MKPYFNNNDKMKQKPLKSVLEQNEVIIHQQELHVARILNFISEVKWSHVARILNFSSEVNWSHDLASTTLRGKNS